MRIFYAAPSTAHQSRLPDSKLWAANLYLPLVDLGHELVVFDFDFSEFNLHIDHHIPEYREFITQNRPRASEELLRQVKATHARQPLDLFFSYFYSAYVEPEAIRAIGELGIVTVNWFCNASYQFYLVSEIAPAYNYCLVPEKYRLADYRRVGARPIYCQEAANPNIYRPYDLPREYDVTFVGQRYGNRPMYLYTLLRKGIDVRAWGPHWAEPYPSRSWRECTYDAAWQLVTAVYSNAGLLDDRPARFPLERCGPPLTDDELIKMYSRSKISLGFTTLAGHPEDGGPLKQVRLRDFEAPMSGAFYLVEYFEELAEFFEPGQEIACFDSPAELVDKARYYLRHEGERERVRQAGMDRARREHTWHKRFEMAFRQMGLS